MRDIINIIKYLYRRPQHIAIHAFSKIFSKSLNLENLNNILIISPHPDDEVFGCGELIKNLCFNNKNLNIIFLSKGEGTYTNSITKASIVGERKKLTYKANRILGLTEENIYYLDFPDGNFKNTPKKETEKLCFFIDNLKPQYIFYPHPWEGSPDHEIASKIIKNYIKEHCEIEGYHYNVWTYHHMPFYKSFKLNYKKSYILNVSGKEKRNAINIYAMAQDKNGNYYSGKLPKMLLKALNWNKELYFKD